MSAPKIKRDEIKEYVKEMIEGVNEGVALSSDFVITSGVRFHIGISNEIKKEGGVDVVVAHVGAETGKTTDSFVEFEVSKKPIIKEKNGMTFYEK